MSAAPLSRGLKEQLHCCVKFTVLLRRHDCGNSGEKQEKNVQIESQIVLHQYLLKPCQKTTMNSWDFGHFRVYYAHTGTSALLVLQMSLISLMTRQLTNKENVKLRCDENCTARPDAIPCL